MFDSISKSTQTPLRITHLVSSLKVGGMEQFVVRLANAQQRRGHIVSILALHDGPLHSGVDNGIRCLVPRSTSTLTRALSAMSMLALMRPQVIHAHNETALHYGLLGKSITGARLLVTEHGFPQDSVRSATGREKAGVDTVVAVSAATAAAVEAIWGRSDVQVIHNGIAPARPIIARQDMRKALRLAPDDVVGICVARIDGRKGHDDLLLAIARIPRVQMLIVGSGAQQYALEKLAAALGVDDRVQFLGHRTDVPDLLSASDFFVLPSLSEGLPMSILEAMAAGLPIVATAVGGVEELVEAGRQGLIVQPSTPDDLATAIGELSADADLRRRYGESARQRVAAGFSFDRMVDRYDDIYALSIGGRVHSRPITEKHLRPVEVNNQ